MKFLIVDDSKLSRKKLSNFIETLGYEVVAQATDGVEGISLYNKYKPDFILTDLEMPNMKGDELAKKVLMLNSDIKIILITSIVDKKELLNALRIGVKKVMQKPITFEKLKLAISEI